MRRRAENDHRKGVLLMVSAALCWSLSGILVRNVSVTNPWEIVFWRSAFMTLFMVLVLARWHGTAAFAKVRSVGRAGMLSGSLLASMFFFFILSLTRTTVANTMVLTSVAPLFVALFGWWFLRERIAPRTWVAMIAALAGIALMFADSLGGGGTAGNLLALCVPLAFGLNVSVLRRMHASVDMVPAVLIAGIISSLVALPLAWPFSATPHDLLFLSALGFLQLGMGCLLMTLATRHLAAAEIGLYSLIENVAAPLWVWVGIGERPGALALAGGAVVISAIGANQWLALRAERVH
jgi:drug/metabolite transporter (DMT)-like permease